MSGLLRLLSQAGSLCVRFRERWRCFSSRPCFAHPSSRTRWDAQNFPASVSSSELSAHQMAPSGDSALAESSRTRAHGSQQLVSRRCGIECQEVQFRHFRIELIRQEEDIILVGLKRVFNLDTLKICLILSKDSGLRMEHGKVKRPSSSYSGRRKTSLL